MDNALASSQRSAGEKRTISAADGTPIDATFIVEGRAGRPTAVIFQSAGGTKGSPAARNTDYLAGLDLLLQRLAELGATIEDALVDSTVTRDLSVSDRRLDPGDQVSYPLSPAEIADVVRLRKSLLGSMARVGREPTSKGGGNQRKALRFVLSGTVLSAAQLAEGLSRGIRPGHGSADLGGSRHFAGSV